MGLQVVTLDFETYWAQGHSLSNMTPIEYVTHPDTQVISCAIKVDTGETRVYFGDEIDEAFAAIDWSKSLAVGHNMSEFDSLILSWRYGITPAMWGCTVAMFRPHFAKTTGVSLRALSERMKVGEKGGAALVQTKGKRLEDFTEDEVEAMREYNKDDVELCYRLFRIGLKKTPADELRIIDRTIRMLAEPKFDVDIDLLQRGLHAERKRKQKMLEDLAARVGAEPSDDLTAVDALKQKLNSTAKFKSFLEDLGVEVPMKTSPKTGREIPAIAKTDEGFERLLNHPDERVSMAANARLGVKSTILESRIGRFIDAANAAGGRLPIALRYYGADTTGRWSGTMKLNEQNLPRIGKKAAISDVLRKSMKAPPGHKVVVADLSGIEMRVNHFLWKVEESMRLFREDPEADLYKAFAADRYQIPFDDVTKDQRFLAKVAQLGLGFGAGWRTFQQVARSMGGLILSDYEAKEIVDDWRRKYADIDQGWRTCHDALTDIHDGTRRTIDPWGMLVTTPEGIQTPKGMIYYPGLHLETNEDDGRSEWWYGQGRRRARIYAGKVTENIVQHLARHVITDVDLAFAKTEVGKECGSLAHTVHDELVYIAPESIADDALAELQGIMRTPPAWWPELVTWSEGDVANSYGEAK